MTENGLRASGESSPRSVVGGMNYGDAMAELLGLAQSHVLPPEVIRALARIFEHPAKLFCFEPDVCTAVGVWTAGPACQLQASNLLVKLVLAARALDWEVIIVAAEQHGVELPDTTGLLLPPVAS